MQDPDLKNVPADPAHRSPPAAARPPPATRAPSPQRAGRRDAKLDNLLDRINNLASGATEDIDAEIAEKPERTEPDQTLDGEFFPPEPKPSQKPG